MKGLIMKKEEERNIYAVFDKAIIFMDDVPKWLG